MSKGKKDKKVSGPKKADKSVRGIGDNSGKKIPGVIKLVDELLHYAEQKKKIAQAERECRNRAKSEFGIMSGPLAHELKLRKMDKDVRVQFESNHQDLKTALGYQPELDFAGAQPTRASAAAQPSEAEMADRAEDDEDGYSVNDDAEEDEQPEDGKDPLEIPESLKRKQPGRIEREG